LSFEAHSSGGAAKKELDGLNKHRGVALAEIESLEIAVIEASRRIADAERDKELAAESAKAERALEIASGLPARAQRLDEALATLAEEGNRFRDDLRQLNNQLGCTHPNEAQFQSLGERAVKAGLMFSPFKIEHMAPHEWYTFEGLCEGWISQITNWAGQRLPLKNEVAE
jgi:hypothetical protein